MRSRYVRAAKLAYQNDRVSGPQASASLTNIIPNAESSQLQLACPLTRLCTTGGFSVWRALLEHPAARPDIH